MKRDIDKIEMVGQTEVFWRRLEPGVRRDQLLDSPYVQRVTDGWIYIKPDNDPDIALKSIKKILRNLFRRSPDLVVRYVPLSSYDKFVKAWRDPQMFKQLSLGADVAEQESRLADYFISTATYGRVCAGEKSVIIGPKGSGKSAIMRALAELPDRKASWHSIVITPETFATSVLQRFIDTSKGVWDEQEAFSSAWIFTILLEVFKRVCRSTGGSSRKHLSRIQMFLAEHSSYSNCDLFTRFVHRLSRIEAIKIGEYEIGFKTRELQKLYSLDDVYSLIPDLRKVLQEDIVILLDELDTGWNNTPHANSFVGSLMRAAIKVQNLDLRIRVVAFLRSEIFDIVKDKLDQLDKLRSSMEHIKWQRNDLMGLILRRVSFSLGLPTTDIDLASIGTIFPDSINGTPSFEYLVSRTTMRPREVLQFVRLAHQKALDMNAISIVKEAILLAEEEFSTWKAEHICSEYNYILPGLAELLTSFRRKSPILNQCEVVDTVENFSLDCPECSRCWATKSALEIVQRLYQIEFLGIERQARAGIADQLAGFEFATERPTASVRGVGRYIIHPAFWQYLEIIGR